MVAAKPVVAVREAQKRAVSSMISTPMEAMKSSSPVAFQYSHTPQATSAEMWCSMRPQRMGTIFAARAEAVGRRGLDALSADSQG